MNTITEQLQSRAGFFTPTTAVGIDAPGYPSRQSGVPCRLHLRYERTRADATDARHHFVARELHAPTTRCHRASGER